MLGKYDDKSYIELRAGLCFVDSEFSLLGCDLIKSSILNEEQLGFVSLSPGISDDILEKLGDNELTDELDDVDGIKLGVEFLFDWLREIIFFVDNKS